MQKQADPPLQGAHTLSQAPSPAPGPKSDEYAAADADADADADAAVPMASRALTAMDRIASLAAGRDGQAMGGARHQQREWF
jgi:hypothetical protein